MITEEFYNIVYAEHGGIELLEGKGGNGAMKKTANFTEKDKALIQRIEQYQKEQGIKTFIDAVRKLCGNALDLRKITK